MDYQSKQVPVYPFGPELPLLFIFSPCGSQRSQTQTLFFLDVFLERRGAARFLGAESRPAVLYYRVEAVGAEVREEG